LAATAVLPVPKKGSKINSPSFVKNLIKSPIRVSGNFAG